MNRRHRPHAHANRERWLVSYADFITLLFAFFVVLYASSRVDNTHVSQLAGVIEGAFHDLGAFQAPTPSVPVNNARDVDSTTDTSIPEPDSNSTGQTAPIFIPGLKNDLEQALADEIQRREVALRIGSEGLVVSLSEIGFFDSGSATLKPGSEKSILRISEVLRVHPVYMRIEGHTDNVPIHTSQFASNWELSTARATEMIKLLITRYGFSPSRLSAAGYGEFHPLTSNGTFDGRRQNRRLDFVILADPSQRPNTVKSGVEASQFASRVLR